MKYHLERYSKNWRNRFRQFRRRWLFPFWQNIQWPLLGSAAAIGIALGYLGFYQHHILTGEESTHFDLLYRSIQLIVFESGDVGGLVPWQLEVARFLLPAVAGYAAIKALLTIFREQWQMLRVRFLRNHVIICGLGNKGLRFAENFLNQGYQVVVIEEDDDNKFLEQVRRQGAFVLDGNAADPDLLHRTVVHKAKYLVAVCPFDGINAEIAILTRRLCEGRKYQNKMIAFIHIIDLELCSMLNDLGLSDALSGTCELRFINIIESGVELLLDENPPFKENINSVNRQNCILIVGLGKMGRSLIVQTANRWLKLQKDNVIEPLRISVIDAAVDRKMFILKKQHPEVEQACEFDLLQMEKNAAEFEEGAFLVDSSGKCDLGIIFICFDDDVHVLVYALTLLRKLKTLEKITEVPIVLRMNRDSGLASLIKEDQGRDLAQVHVFGLLDRTCNLKALFGEEHYS
jgi:voltage-gated potassium channel Kch